jgi:hypothetical protein
VAYATGSPELKATGPSNSGFPTPRSHHPHGKRSSGQRHGTEPKIARDEGDRDPSRPCGGIGRMGACLSSRYLSDMRVRRVSPTRSTRCAASRPRQRRRGGGSLSVTFAMNLDSCPRACRETGADGKTVFRPANQFLSGILTPCLRDGRDVRLVLPVYDRQHYREHLHAAGSGFGTEAS